MNKRDGSLDVLRTIGILTIILSHTRNTPIVIDYLRNFEVFLLILVSGTLLCKKNIVGNKKSYFLKRIKRIVIPTWFFLTLLFSLLFLVSLIRKTKFPYSWFTILDSYLMINGVGYVWIMLIYCFIAAGAPVLLTLLKKSDKASSRIIVLSLWGTAYFVATWFVMNCMSRGVIQYYLKNTVPYFLIYSLISIIPLLENKVNFGIKLVTFFLLLVIHFGLILIIKSNGFNLDISIHKYPPDIFYISYALGAAGLIFVFVRQFYHKSASWFSQFVSRNSQWMYFNHILAIYVWNELDFSDKWFIMYAFVLAVALILTLIQRLIVNNVYKCENEHVVSLCKIIFG